MLFESSKDELTYFRIVFHLGEGVKRREKPILHLSLRIKLKHPPPIQADDVVIV
jgi:hypothetical protein